MTIYDTIVEYAKDCKPLTNEEEQALAVLIQEGDTEARDKLVRHNMLYALKMCGQFMKSPYFRDHTDDIVQGAMEGLMWATEKYDGRIRFAAYAARPIRWRISAALDPVVSATSRARGVPSAIKKVAWAYGELKTANYYPDYKEVNEKLDVTINDSIVRSAVAVLQTRDMRLDAIMAEENASTWHDVIADDAAESPDKAAEVSSLGELLDNAMAHLTLSEAYALRRVYGLGGEDPVLKQDVAAEMGVSRQTVSYYLRTAMGKMRGDSPQMSFNPRHISPYVKALRACFEDE